VFFLELHFKPTYLEQPVRSGGSVREPLLEPSAGSSPADSLPCPNAVPSSQYHGWHETSEDDNRSSSCSGQSSEESRSTSLECPDQQNWLYQQYAWLQVAG